MANFLVRNEFSGPLVNNNVFIQQNIGQETIINGALEQWPAYDINVNENSSLIIYSHGVFHNNASYVAIPINLAPGFSLRGGGRRYVRTDLFISRILSCFNERQNFINVIVLICNGTIYQYPTEGDPNPLNHNANRREWALQNREPQNIYVMGSPYVLAFNNFADGAGIRVQGRNNAPWRTLDWFINRLNLFAQERDPEEPGHQNPNPVAYNRFRSFL